MVAAMALPLIILSWLSLWDVLDEGGVDDDDDDDDEDAKVHVCLRAYVSCLVAPQ